MKSWIILIVLAVSMTAAATMAVPYLSYDSTTKDLAYPAPAKRDGPAPVVKVVEDLVYNFGTLPQKYKGKRAWTFKNEGAGPLELRGAGSTCSCTTAALFTGDKKEAKSITIPPGESLPIEVSFDTKEWNNDKWSQNITVGTNDPAVPTIVLKVEGNVKPAIITVPPDPSLSYGVVGNEEEIFRKIACYSVDRPDFQITKATSSNPALIEVTPRPMDSSEAAAIGVEKGWVIQVTMKPTSNLGAFAEEVSVQTDHPQKSEFHFKVAGKVTGAISSLPERITVRGATAKEGGTENLKLLARGRESVQFTVSRKPQALEIVIEPITMPAGTKGSQYKMTVKVAPGSESGRIVDEIVLKTDDPKASEVKIPVDVLVQGAK